MGIALVLAESALRIIADFEFRLSSVGDKLKWRKRWLHLMRVSHGQSLWVGQAVYIRNRGNLFIGERSSIGSFARIWNYAPIHIGEDFISAGNLTLNSATHDPVTLAPIGKEIWIGDRVWCGINVTILAGVKIGNDCVIGAGSVVTKDVPPFSIAAGLPARRIKALERKADENIFTLNHMA